MDCGSARREWRSRRACRRRAVANIRGSCSFSFGSALTRKCNASSLHTSTCGAMRLHARDRPRGIFDFSRDFPPRNARHRIPFLVPTSVATSARGESDAFPEEHWSEESRSFVVARHRRRRIRAGRHAVARGRRREWALVSSCCSCKSDDGSRGAFTRRSFRRLSRDTHHST